MGRRGWLGRGVDRHHSALPEVRLVHTCAFKYVSGNILCACTNAPLGLAARVEGRGYLCLSSCVHESVWWKEEEEEEEEGTDRTR